MADKRWPEVRFRAMGCQMAAWLDAPAGVAEPALAAVQPAMARFERIFSRFLPASELSMLNSRPQEAVVTSEELFEVVEQALVMAKVTEGLFDPTLLDSLIAAGYDRELEALPFVTFSDRLRSEIVDPVRQGWRDIYLDRQALAITLPPQVRLDLGGIAKGWSAQRVARDLAPYGPCLVDAGGDLVAVGAPNGLSGWPVALAEPGGGEHDLLNLWLSDASAATSGVDRRHWERDGRRMHHLIDPRTGAPAQTDVLTSTVIAPDAVEAEAWAKASLMLGAVEGTGLLAGQVNLAGALLADDGTLYLTSTMRRWINAGG